MHMYAFTHTHWAVQGILKVMDVFIPLIMVMIIGVDHGDDNRSVYLQLYTLIMYHFYIPIILQKSRENKRTLGMVGWSVWRNLLCCKSWSPEKLCVLQILDARQAPGACGVSAHWEQTPLSLQYLSFALHWHSLTSCQLAKEKYLKASSSYCRTCKWWIRAKR